MLYRPNFCCCCGEKIVRAEWNLFTSRRFCLVCSVENKRYDVFSRVVIVAGMLASIFGLGVIFGGSRDPGINRTDIDAKRLVSEPAERDNPPRSAPLVQRNLGSGVSEDTSDLGQADKVLRSASSQNGLQTAFDPKKVDLPVYYCGAMTKKGTPCSRRVKHKGERCWQHQGKGAPLPEN